jgi:hypothetical protein
MVTYFSHVYNMLVTAGVGLYTVRHLIIATTLRSTQLYFFQGWKQRLRGLKKLVQCLLVSKLQSQDSNSDESESRVEVFYWAQSGPFCLSPCLGQPLVATWFPSQRQCHWLMRSFRCRWRASWLRVRGVHAAGPAMYAEVWGQKRPAPCISGSLSPC